MEYDQIKKQNEEYQRKTAEIEETLRSTQDQQHQDREKLKKMKAYINKQKQQLSEHNEKLNAQTQTIDTLQTKHAELAKEYESKAIMANEHES